jgi:predicted RNA-binding protein YlxR (DUF448 family)
MRRKNISIKHAAVKPVPQRTCLACRQVKAKREMLRIVKTPEGKMELDVSGKKEGRGAYVCRDCACWEKVKINRQLERALKTNISSEDLKKIFEEGTDYLKELDSG